MYFLSNYFSKFFCNVYVLSCCYKKSQNVNFINRNLNNNIKDNIASTNIIHIQTRLKKQ